MKGIHLRVVVQSLPEAITFYSELFASREVLHPAQNPFSLRKSFTVPRSRRYE